MTAVGDIVTYITGMLGTIAIFMWRYEKKKTDDSIVVLQSKQTDGLSRLAVIESQLKVLEEIKVQQVKMAEDLTTIRVTIAQLPKRHNDEG